MKLVVLFFVSGALALVYQVLWQRQFALLFGSSAAATAAVLGAFFTGLGIGSAWIGNLAPRWTRPLRVYAILELLVGLGALLVTPALSGFGNAYPWLAHHFGQHPAGFMAVKATIAFVAIAIPTLAMGGTLPVLGQYLDRGPRHLGSSAGRFYVANTAGAALGALSVPFALLPALGAQGTLVVCAAANAVVALLAWQLDRRDVDAVPVPAPAPAKPSGRGRSHAISRSESPAASWDPGTGRAWLLLSLASGGITFSLQVLWNRAFAQIHENSLHAFAVIATVFILALAVGAQAACVALRRGRDPGTLLRLAWIAGGVLTMLAPWVFVASTGNLAFLAPDAGWARQAGRLLGLAFTLLFLPMALLGVGFPALMEAAGRASNSAAGPVLGRLIGLNIVGCVAGSLAAGFILPQGFGLWGSLVLTGATAAVAGCWIPIHPTPAATKASPRTHRLRLAATTVAGILGIALFVASSQLPRVRIASRQNERLLDLQEGPHGIVAVTERPGSRRLKLNNHYALGGTLSLGDQRMQAHIPLILHPNPRRVGHLGLGTGLSAGGVLFHPATTVDVVELVPEVVQAARTHFAEAAGGLFSDPRVRIVVDDARNYLRSHPEPFDVLIGDLVVPWRQGESALFTREHFAAAREALRPGGLFCQWLPMFQLSEVEARILLETFLSVFPQAYLWRGDFSPNRPAIGLIGVAQAMSLDPASVRTRLAETRPDPANPQLADPAGFWMNFIGSIAATDLTTGGGRLHTEDHPWLELLGPRTHGVQGRSTLFTGRALQTWLAEIRRRSEPHLATVTDTEWKAARSGDDLFEFSLALLERNEAKANRLRQQLEQQLPPTVVRAIFGVPNP